MSLRFIRKNRPATRTLLISSHQSTQNHLIFVSQAELAHLRSSLSATTLALTRQHERDSAALAAKVAVASTRAKASAVAAVATSDVHSNTNTVSNSSSNTSSVTSVNTQLPLPSHPQSQFYSQSYSLPSSQPQSMPQLQPQPHLQLHSQCPPSPSLLSVASTLSNNNINAYSRQLAGGSQFHSLAGGVPPPTQGGFPSTHDGLTFAGADMMAARSMWVQDSTTRQQQHAQQLLQQQQQQLLHSHQQQQQQQQQAHSQHSRGGPLSASPNLPN